MTQVIPSDAKEPDLDESDSTADNVKSPSDRAAPEVALRLFDPTKMEHQKLVEQHSLCCSRDNPQHEHHCSVHRVSVRLSFTSTPFFSRTGGA